jgi:hypothetical protein
MAACRAISKFKKKKIPVKNSLALYFLLEKVNALKRILNPEKLQAARRAPRKAKSFLTSEMYESI